MCFMDCHGCVMNKINPDRKLLDLPAKLVKGANPRYQGLRFFA